MKAKYPLLSLISIAACGIIGTAWAKLMIMLSGLRYASDGGNALPMLFLLTFAAVSVIYAAAERLGIKFGFSKGEFFIWFVIIPFLVIPDLSDDRQCRRSGFAAVRRCISDHGNGIYHRSDILYGTSDIIYNPHSFKER